MCVWRREELIAVSTIDPLWVPSTLDVFLSQTLPPTKFYRLYREYCDCYLPSQRRRRSLCAVPLVVVVVVVVVVVDDYSV